MGHDADAPPLTLDDYAQRARNRLDAATWAYVDGGAADELTLAENLEAWQRLRLLPRVLRDLRSGHLQTPLLGREWPLPLLVAPMAAQRLVHADGERGVALAAAAQETGLVLSGQSSIAPPEVAALVRDEPGRGPLWQQLLLHADPGLNRQLAIEAQASGFEALVVSVDAPVQGARDRQRRAGFALPPHAVADARHGPQAPPAGATGLCGGGADRAATWAQLARFVQDAPLPVLLKGVLHPDDAAQALQIGCRGVIVSNHGGRTLDTAVATAHALPAIADAMDGHGFLLVDGGIRRGTDIVKALALGADAVLIGRPVLHGLASAGALGVAHVIRLLRDELEMALVLCGCRTLADISPALLHRRGTDGGA
jgi:4-hydroxymandelate oxidase